MKIFCLLICGLTAFGLTVCAQTPQPKSWYKCMTGTIDKYPVTMHLHKAGNRYSGYYYYESTQEPMFFFGSDTGKAKLLELSANWTDGVFEEFTGVLTSRSYTGNWYKSDTSQPVKFSLTVSPDTVSNGYDYIYTQGSQKYQPKWKESPEASFSAASIWPKSTNPNAEFLKNVIRKAHGAEKSADDIGKILLDQKRNYLADYMKGLKETPDSDLKSSPYMFSYEETSELSIVYTSPTIISLGSYFYNYTGGAHGMYGTTYEVYDLVNKRKLELKDVINLKDSLFIISVLEKKLRRIYKLKPQQALSEVLFEDTLSSISDNFLITSKGIGFNYLPYEIAAFALGEITIFIPYADLHRALRPEFLKLIGK